MPRTWNITAFWLHFYLKEFETYSDMNQFNKFRYFLAFICDWDMNILQVIQSNGDFLWENSLESI